ncbi:phage tail protein [Escherichia coli]|uniref:phage tail protein n=1 Tax=Escherichia coli TaxID=562 RepID=UPI001EEEA209|nr:phage tail protein [Escherichia coli]EES5963511.1 phage tail protein [Escherichia coli]HCO0803426.1 phage tail protein [Escherichia coli]
MTTKYFAILTHQGAARLANATALGTKLNITQMAVGDGNGTLPTPDPAQTKLINERRRELLNSLAVDANDTGQIIAEQIIPENEGGFFIREIGLYDDEGILIAVANCPETYKPLLAEGSGRTQTIRMILVVSSTSAITLKIDPSVVLATRKYVDDAVIEVKSYADKLMKDHEAKANPHKQYPLIANALKEMADAGLVAEVLKNLGLGEAAKRNVGNGENQIPDMSFWTVTGGNGNFVIRQPDGLITQMVTVSISGPVAMNGMTDNAYAITGSNKSYIATATLPFVFPNKVLGVIPLVSTTAYGGVSSNITGSYATAVCSFAAVRGNNTIVFKVDKPLNAAFPSDTSVSALIIGR